MVRKLLSLLTLTSCTHGGVNLINDWGAYGVKNEDKYLTHATKFSYYKDSKDLRETYSISQTIYTPSYKRADATKEQLENNRPYTGFLAAEYRNAKLTESGKTIYGIQAGCSGRCSYAKEVQSGVHKLLDQNIPTWDRNYSLKSEPGLILQGEKYYDVIRNGSKALALFSRGKFGNIIDSFSLGSNFYYGKGIPDHAPEPITFKTDLSGTEDWSYYLFSEAEARYVLYNHFLEGSLFQDERHTVDSNPFVFQADLGVRFGYKNVTFSYNYTLITDEWHGQGGAFMFGGISLDW